MQTKTWADVQKAGFKYKSAIKFISDLQKKGISLSAIDVNDWNSSPNTIVGITIPYGSKNNGGKTKSWKNRFGETSVKSAVKFWNTKN